MHCFVQKTLSPLLPTAADVVGRELSTEQFGHTIWADQHSYTGARNVATDCVH